MWNADRYNRALRFAGEWHEEQKVPGTEISYLESPLLLSTL